ncbi:hypothetical protein BK049_11800 [Bacillus xiamenensis]|uniref:BppU N-terminal domain-containing protein n=1 Tax=Bacillus xiamenensis TaxID=1178537 RepID=A0AAC9IGN1_9BACI|nr:phage baseplate upper protein [Bacillus xiamenensis]AOZ89310.1 hypothetical protein BK049_11800 [Bacillus xiamenensis]
MIRKNGPLDFDVNAYTSSSISTSINFWTQDRQTARLIFKLTKDGVPLPLAAVTGKLVLVMDDGSRFIRDVTIVDRVNGHAEYVLSDQEIKHYGIVQAELNLYYTNDQSMSVHQFSFNISKSLIDQDIVPITEYYVDEFEALREKINELYEETIQTIDELRSKFEDLEKIETKEGAQSKADTALAAAKKYSDVYAKNSEIHVTEAEKNKWNNGQLYKMTQDSGTRKLIPDGSDLLTLPPGFYFGINNRLLNNPDPSDTGWFNYDVSESGSGRKMILATASYKNTMWYGTVHTNGDFKGWKRVVTDADLTSSWNQVTFVTGTTKHFASNPLQFSIRLNSLHLRGSFEGIPANDTVIARFAQKPSGETAFLGATVGSYGSARLTLEKDGSLKFNGLNANDNSKVSRVEINESIPLW